MMFLSFILLFLLIKTLQEEQYYKLIEGEQFYIMSQEDENGFYLLSKNQIYFSNYIFNFSSKITIDIDPAYIPIYIRTNDYYFFNQDTEKWIYYYGHSYIVYENKEETSNSYIIVIYHFRTCAIQYQFSIDKLNLFQKKFFFLFEDFTFAILGKVDNYYIAYVYDLNEKTLLTTKTVFEDIYPESTFNSYHNNYECNFMTDFFISTIFDCFIFQILTLLLKSLIYIFILKGRKNNCIRGCLICVVSSFPWIFNL